VYRLTLATHRIGGLWQARSPAQVHAMLTPFDISCPYCGESIEILVDESAGDQSYIEDCQVCCRPITLSIRLDADGDAQVAATAENDA
jgi:cysteine-rich CPXCG protein